MTSTVYISHAKNDSVMATALAQSLRANGLEVLPGHDVSPGTEAWSALIQGQIDKADCFVILLRRNMAQDIPALYYELGRAMAQQKRIIPILLDNAPADSLPASLRDHAIRVPSRKSKQATFATELASMIQSRIQPGATQKVGRSAKQTPKPRHEQGTVARLRAKRLAKRKRSMVRKP
jgi:nucleoside 2-deoxyribosyltransferase